MAYPAYVKVANTSGLALRWIETDHFGHDIGNWSDVTDDLKQKGLDSEGRFYFEKSEQRYVKYSFPESPM